MLLGNNGGCPVDVGSSPTKSVYISIYTNKGVPMKILITSLLTLLPMIACTKDLPEDLFSRVYHISEKYEEDSYVIRLINPTSRNLTCKIQIDNEIDFIITSIRSNSLDSRIYVVEGLNTKFNYACMLTAVI